VSDGFARFTVALAGAAALTGLVAFVHCVWLLVMVYMHDHRCAEWMIQKYQIPGGRRWTGEMEAEFVKLTSAIEISGRGLDLSSWRRREFVVDVTSYREVYEDME